MSRTDDYDLANYQVLHISYSDQYEECPDGDEPVHENEVELTRS